MDTTISFLLDQSNDFFCVMDRNGIINHTNVAFRRALGYSQSEITGKQINEISHPADIRRRLDILNLLSRKKQVSDYESRIKGIDGCYYNIKWNLVFNTADNLVYATGVNLQNKLPDKTLAESIHHVIQSFSEGFVVIDRSWKIISFNPAFQAITGYNAKKLKSLNLRATVSLGITPEVISTIETAFNENTSGQLQYFNEYDKRWLRLNIYPFKSEVMVFIRDITSIKTQQLILALEKEVLEINASSSYSLQQTINELLKGIETIFPDMICSVLEVDENQERVWHLAGPRLPEAYCTAINGQRVGPKAGSCGTAVFHRSQVIVSHIDADPLWDDYRQYVSPYGLKACWSTPIISSHSNQVLATFAVYYSIAREPQQNEQQIIDRTTNILRILIENKKNIDNIQDQNKRMQEIASISSHEIRRPVATILGLVNLFDIENALNPLNREIITHLESTAKELDDVIHAIVEKTIYFKSRNDMGL